MLVYMSLRVSGVGVERWPPNVGLAAHLSYALRPVAWDGTYLSLHR